MAGIINKAQAKPKIAPEIVRERCVFSQISKYVSDQSMPIGIMARNNQIRGKESVLSRLRKNG